MSEPVDHPLRATLSGLMHQRTIPVFASPAVVRSWVSLVGDEERAAEAEWVATLEASEPASEDGRLAHTGAGGGMIWERHGEFSTWLKYDSAPDPRFAARKGLGFCTLRTADFGWLCGAPGRIFRSVEIVVARAEPKPAQFDGVIDLARAFQLLAANPAKLLGVDAGVLAEGAQADIAVIDPDRPWIVDSRKMAAAAGNTPFDRQPVQGRVVALFKGGARVS